MENFSTALAAVSSLAAAIAACMSYRTSKQSLCFQKNLARSQNYFQKLASTLTKMESLKILLDNLSEISDEQFKSIEPLYLDIKSDLQYLSESIILKGKPSSFFSASSLGEAVGQTSNHRDEINHEIGQIKKVISEMFGKDG